MKLLAIFLISLLFTQAIVDVEASDAAHSLSQEDAGGNFESLAAKKCKIVCVRKCSFTPKKKLCSRTCKKYCGAHV